MFEKIKYDIAQSYYQQNFPNDGQRFVAWYVRNIHGQDANQTRYCITDAGLTRSAGFSTSWPRSDAHR